MLQLLLKGLLIGAAVSMPVGPMAILIIQRTANKSFKVGYSSALGVIFADAIFVTVAGFSLSFIMQFLMKYELVFQVISAVVLLILGYSIFKANPSKNQGKIKNESYLQHFASTWLISSSNPAIILAYIAILASSNISFQATGIPHAIYFVLGFIIGAAGWWLILTSVVNYFRHKFNHKILQRFNQISGASIMTFVVIAIIIVLFKDFRL